MPKTKKQSQRSSVSTEKKVTGSINADNAENSTCSSENDEIFAQVQEMFSGQVDPDVIHMVLSESEWRVDEAIDTLFSLMAAEDNQVDKRANKLYDLASSVLDSKPAQVPLSGDNYSSGGIHTTMTTRSRIHGNIGTSENKTSDSCVSSLKNEPLMNFNFYSHGTNPNEPLAAKSSNMANGSEIHVGIMSSNTSVTSNNRTIASSNQHMGGYGLDTFDLYPSGIVQPSDPLVKVEQDIPSKIYRRSSDKHVPITQGVHADSNTSVANNFPLHMTSMDNSMLKSHDNDAVLLPPQNRSCLKTNGFNMTDFNPADSYKRTASLIDDYASGLTAGNPSQGLLTIPKRQLNKDFIEKTAVPNLSKALDSDMKVTERVDMMKKQKFEILKSVNAKYLEDQKIYFSHVEPASCGTVSGLSGEEARGSNISSYALSPAAPEFVPRGVKSLVNMDTGQQAYTGGLIDPSEMSAPQVYANKPGPFVNRSWRKPTEKFSLSDVLKQSRQNASHGSKQPSQKSALKNVEREIIEKYVNSNKKVLVILRGCPGSGKSSLAREIKFGGIILTTDDFFMRGNFYEYDQGLLGDAHFWNQQRSESCMKSSISPVIIDNTNTQKWEMRPYVLQAVKYHYDIELMEPQTKWKYKARELAKRNSHGVGLESIQRMLQRFEYNVTVEDIINTVQINQMPNRAQVIKPLDSPSSSDQNSANQSNSTTGISLQADLIMDHRKSQDYVTTTTPPSGVTRKPIQGKTPDSSADVIIESEEEVYIGDETASSRGGVLNSLLNNNIGDKSSVHYSGTVAQNVLELSERDSHGSFAERRNLGAAITDNIMTKGLGASISGNNFATSTDGAAGGNLATKTMTGMFPGNDTQHSAVGSSSKATYTVQDHIYERNHSPFQSGSLFSRGSMDSISSKSSDLEPISASSISRQVDEKSQGIQCPKPFSSLPSSASSSTSSISNKVSDLEPIPLPLGSVLLEASNVAKPSEDKSYDLISNMPYPVDKTSEDDSCDLEKNSAFTSGAKSFEVLRMTNRPDYEGKHVEENPHSQHTNSAPPATAVQVSETYNKSANVELGSAELDILAQLEADLSNTDSLAEIDVIANEFKALVYYTSIEEAAMEELERQLGEKVRLWKMKYENNTDEEGSKVTSTAKLDSGPEAFNVVEKQRQQEDLHVVDKKEIDVVESVWEEPAPKPQRRLRDHSKSQELVTETQASDIASSETGSGVSETEDKDQDPKTDVQQMKPPASTGVSKSQRKRRKNKPKRPPSPFLEDKVKEKFLTTAWTFPVFETSDSGEDSTGCIKTSRDSMTKSKPKSKALLKIEHSTNTSPRDFNILHCVNQGYRASAIDMEFKLLGVQKRDINAGIQTNHGSNERTIGDRSTVDCSTSTDDLQEELNEKFGLDFLQSCFKDVPVDDLKDVLVSCANDVGVAVNILLEWGYDSIDSPKEREKIALYRLQSTDDQELHMASFVSAKTTHTSKQPLQLADMCSKVLKLNLTFSDKYIEELLISGSQKRLDVVEKMTMHCERLLSAENTAGTDKNVWVKEGTVLCMYSNSEDSEVDSCSDINEEFQSSVLPSDQCRGEESTSTKEAAESESAPVVTEKVLPAPFSEPGGHDTDGTEDCATETTSGTEILVAASEAEAMKYIPIQLSKETIHALENLFGPVGAETEEVVSQIAIDHKTAKQLHDCLRNSMLRYCQALESQPRLEAAKPTLKDEAPASAPQSKQKNASKRRRRNLDLPSLRTLPSPIKQAHEPSVYNQYPVSMIHPYPVNSFREILDEETAKQLSKEEHLKWLEAAGDTAALSTRLKRQKLEKLFPGVNDNMLDEFFEANRYSLGETFKALQSVLGTADTPKTVMTDEMAKQHEHYFIKLAKEKSLQELESKMPSSVVVTSEPERPKALNGLEYHDFRAEAFTHHKLRQECFKKAQDAYSRGMKDVASFYSQQGHLHTEKLRGANRRASQKILNSRNNDLDNASTIDLHGLHPDEAVYHLSQILQERQQELSQLYGHQRCHLSVITGKGVHSRGGRAKLKPAVVNFLTKSNYSWSLQSSGVVQVVLRG